MKVDNLNMALLTTLLQLSCFLSFASAKYGDGPTIVYNSQGSGDNTTLLLDQLLTNYDRRLRPDFGGEPTLIDVNLNIRSMGPITEREMAYQLDCYFRQSWVDKRLSFIGDNNNQTLTVSNKILDRIWKPDTHFYNGKKSYLHMITFPNKFFRIQNTGKILYSMRLTIKASCPMHLEKFPMDTQDCPLMIGSHGYTVDDVHYKWTYGVGHSIKMAQDMRLSQFDLIGYPQSSETYKRPGGGFYSSLSCRFLIRRHMGYFLINVYVPCSLMVVISWVAFFINREATADRIALGVTTVLTMTFLGLDNRNDLPKVSYSTALDYFVATCFAFVLASILQFAGVHYFTKHGSGEIPQIFMYSSDEEDTVVQHEANEYDSEESDDVIINGDQERSYSLVRKAASPYGRMNGTAASAQSTAAVSSNNNSHHHRYQQNQHRKYVSSTASCQHQNITTSAAHQQHQNLILRKRAAPPGRKRLKSHNRDNCLTQFWNCVKGSTTYQRKQKKASEEGVNSVSNIDRLSRFLFPMAFVTFNVVYWLYYLDKDSVTAMFQNP